jgi:ribosome biogenesis GTPase / thiamine phosphate phosphatase
VSSDSTSPSLVDLGWNSSLDTALAQLRESESPDTDLVLARVVVQQRGFWTTLGPEGELLADLRGKFRRDTALIDVPGVGDFVLIAPRAYEQRATIHYVVPRRSVLVRKVAGRTTEAQVIAANIDTVFITVALDNAISVRRLERQIASVWEGGATPVVVGTKSDAVIGEAIVELHAAAIGTDVVVISARNEEGLEQLDRYLTAGSTLALLGPSGAGKSTLTNALLGELRMTTQDVRAIDGKGRHTTTHRELVILPSGAMLVDTPGLREMAMWDADEGLAEVFDDLVELAQECRFSNCSHGSEPSCAIQSALSEGVLTIERFEAWQHLQRELAHLARQQDVRLAAEEKRKWIQRSKEAKDRTRP